MKKGSCRKYGEARDEESECVRKTEKSDAYVDHRRQTVSSQNFRLFLHSGVGFLTSAKYCGQMHQAQNPARNTSKKKQLKITEEPRKPKSKNQLIGHEAAQNFELKCLFCRQPVQWFGMTFYATKKKHLASAEEPFQSDEIMQIGLELERAAIE